MAKILVAEDDAALRDLVVRSFNEDGHELTVTTDGVAVLEALNRHNGEFDLLLTDVKMPEVDGIAIALAAGRDHPGIAIMLMTGFADQRERTHGLDALVHNVIAKPFSVDQIKGAVREALVHRH
jgi:two-component system cell cycle response regulator CpdR